MFAASSLAEAFEDLARQFGQSHPRVAVKLNFAGSQVLRLQIAQGAAADVFASADQDHLRALHAAGLASQPKTFAHNALVIIVPAENPARIQTFDDLPRARRVVLGTPHVPVGAYAREMLGRAAAQRGEAFADAVRSHVVSEESNARLVRAKVALGEADAAIVYRTDAASDQVQRVAIPPELNPRASYPIGVVTRSPRRATARQFVDFVLSAEGQATLVRHGFIEASP